MAFSKELTFHGGKAASLAEGGEHQEDYNAWGYCKWILSLSCNIEENLKYTCPMRWIKDIKVLSETKVTSL